MSNWSDCNGCRYYDSSVDACNCDDKCYIDGAREFAEWLLVNHTLECIECNHGDKSIGCKECAKEYVAEWQNETNK